MDPPQITGLIGRPWKPCKGLSVPVLIGLKDLRTFLFSFESTKQNLCCLRERVKMPFAGALCALEPLLPIPNRKVKWGSADDSKGATLCENRSVPALK